MAETRSTSDHRRATAVAVAATAQCLVPTLGPLLLGSHEEVDDYDTVITPPRYAFIVWAPIFAATLAHAGQQARRRSEPIERSSGWPLASSYALNTAWSVAAQSGRFGLTPALLPASTICAAVAFRRLQQSSTDGSSTGTTLRLAPVSTGLLLGWTALASGVNVLAGSQLFGARPGSRLSVIAAVVSSLAVSSGLSLAIRRSTEGRLALAAPAAWGLGTTALDRNRPAGVRLASAVGALAVAHAAALPKIRARSQ